MSNWLQSIAFDSNSCKCATLHYECQPIRRKQTGAVYNSVMRPTYETPADRSKERQIIDVVAGKFGMRAVKLPQFQDIDFALMKGDVVWGVVEIKARRQHYPQMFLSLHKVQALRQYAAAGLQARVIYATPQGIYAKKVGPLEIDGWIGIGGRKDRNDPVDTELMVHWGDLVINGQTMKAEQDPMTKICDSNPEWFA